MESDQKLTALKKAYADIILNISKEAAARVMSSETRAARFEHELKAGKEEGFRMLMRLKQMMDHKVSQSEIASLNQQKQIEELEAQLHEAEDIVKDLREELGEARAEIERLKRDTLHHSNEPIHANFSNGHSNPEENFSNATMPKPSQRNERCKCDSEIVCTCCSYRRNRDLPSIILRGKEDGLYRNGCTQRIRACVRNLSDKVLSHSEETDRANAENNNISEQLQRQQEEGEDTSKAHAFQSKILTELERKLLPDNRFSNFKSFPQKRRRATRARKIISPLNGNHVPILVKDSAQFCGDLTETAQVLSQLKTETMAHLGPEKSSGKVSDLVEISSDIILQNDEGDVGFAENFSSPGSKIEVEKADLPSNGLESKGSPSVKERVIKYTFQRKRKREALLSESKGNDAEIEMEKKARVEQNDDENSKTKESSRESRRLAQVARQLISLSEKKWWN